MPRSACAGVTHVVVEALRFLSDGLGVALLAVAVFVIKPQHSKPTTPRVPACELLQAPAFTLTVSKSVAVTPASTVPKSAITWLFIGSYSDEPCDTIADTKVVPNGRVSV